LPAAGVCYHLPSFASPPRNPMAKSLIIAEKPSVAADIARAGQFQPAR
jgi:hypothetical protein